MIPVIKAFQDRHNVADMVVVADAGMLSAKNLQDLDDAGLRFIVGSRQTKAPQDLAKYFHWHGTHHVNRPGFRSVLLIEGELDHANCLYPGVQAAGVAFDGGSSSPHAVLAVVGRPDGGNETWDLTAYDARVAEAGQT